ncbi:phosphoenolpyruvate synthase [Ammonifex degensii KC4]|uniref:Phosphoenolpyruvate synthase n=1 Tax=Ammonifex degensii (strain DSM 10501 / KC4) TaxID=429009 RepID=C9R943_AMMDK|nr:phosphoenolpyruvate synthase [Ammonifex degensii]ACX52822.1 phosphoenolpyruvate synthase [Ammonifex degensii KC4]
MGYRFIRWFHELTKEDIPLVGGKGANLGELTQAGIPVPPGFCVTAEAYKHFIEATGLAPKIKEIIASTNVDNLEELMQNTERVRELIKSTPVPPEIEEEIVSAYKELAAGGPEPAVAVRSSATAEDLPEASFAGQQETYLNVRGTAEVVEAVRKCWASLWTARATAYRQAQGFDHFAVYLSAVVQKMIQSERSGVAFTVNPVTGVRDELMINASWGLGEAVVSGAVTPDEYLVDKNTRRIKSKNIASKSVMIVARPDAPSGTVKVEVARHLGPEYVEKQCLSDEEILELTDILLRVEKHYGSPQDIEWGYEKGKFYILQARPVTALDKLKGEEKKEERLGEAKVLVQGMGASPGIASGKVVLVKSFDDITRVKEGSVLVTTMTNPDMVPAMKRAAAIVTDEGGRTCHAAIVSRELGIPCIVGTKNATTVLKEGMEVTVDAVRGVVYEGRVALGTAAPEAKPGSQAIPADIWQELAPVTATKIYMNLGEPEAIARYKDLPFDGIGLMRTEFIFTDHIGAHPIYLLRTGQEKFFIDRLAEGIATVAQAVFPRPVVVRFSDFRTNEFRGLKGGEEVEPVENNPMIGWRGVSRYISPEYEEGFRLECRAMRKVREQYQLTNVWAMLPFVRTTWEVEQVLKIMAEEGLSSNNDFKVWIMAEVPAVIFLADQFCAYVDGFSIGSNDLTQLILGADRDSGILERMGYFDERNPAVTRAIARLIEVAHQHGKTVSICGQGPSVYPELTEFLVRCGIDSVSVNPDMVVRTRRLVASVEKKIILESLRRLK